jgi:xanthine dehydrogenase YagT iron-sulfur-binding subunit
VIRPGRVEALMDEAGELPDEATDGPSAVAQTDSASPTGISRRELIAGAAVAGAGLAASAVTSKAIGRSLGAPSASQPSGTVPVTLRINGRQYDLTIEPRVTLLDALRENLGLTGTKMGCDHGQCGACTVLIDGRRINSCLTLAVMHQGREITTIEGLARGDTLHPVQAAFVEFDGFQCGYCTPGQICSAVGLLNEGHASTPEEIREQMSGNICRCGAYPNIVKAVQQTMRPIALIPPMGAEH